MCLLLLLVNDRQLFIFYRLLRPEFVRDRGRKVLRRLNLPRDHKFPTVKVTNPMMFAITFARSATGGDKKPVKDKPPSGGSRCVCVRRRACDTAVPYSLVFSGSP